MLFLYRCQARILTIRSEINGWQWLWASVDCKWAGLWAFAVRGGPWRTANTLVCRASYPTAHGKDYF
jgi:hypothetical protein